MRQLDGLSPIVGDRFRRGHSTPKAGASAQCPPVTKQERAAVSFSMPLLRGACADRGAPRGLFIRLSSARADVVALADRLRTDVTNVDRRAQQDRAPVLGTLRDVVHLAGEKIQAL